jgi:hypothetical protein
VPTQRNPVASCAMVFTVSCESPLSRSRRSKYIGSGAASAWLAHASHSKANIRFICRRSRSGSALSRRRQFRIQDRSHRKDACVAHATPIAADSGKCCKDADLQSCARNQNAHVGARAGFLLMFIASSQRTTRKREEGRVGANHKRDEARQSAMSAGLRCASFTHCLQRWHAWQMSWADDQVRAA